MRAQATRRLAEERASTPNSGRRARQHERDRDPHRSSDRRRVRPWDPDCSSPSGGLSNRTADGVLGDQGSKVLLHPVRTDPGRRTQLPLDHACCPEFAAHPRQQTGLLVWGETQIVYGTTPRERVCAPGSFAHLGRVLDAGWTQGSEKTDRDREGLRRQTASELGKRPRCAWIDKGRQDPRRTRTPCADQLLGRQLGEAYGACRPVAAPASSWPSTSDAWATAGRRLGSGRVRGLMSEGRGGVTAVGRPARRRSPG